MERRTAIPPPRQIRSKILRKISYCLPPRNQLTSGDRTPARTSPREGNRGGDTSLVEFAESFQEFHTRITHPDWIDKLTGSRRESQIFNHSLTPFEETVGLQYNCTRMGGDYKLSARIKRNASRQGHNSDDTPQAIE